MRNEGERLAAVQYAGQLDIDRIYGPLARQVDPLVRRYWPGGLAALPGLVDAVAALVAGAEPALAAVVVDAAVAAETTADPAGTPDALALAALGVIAPRSLAENRPSVLRQTARLLRRGVNLGLTAAQTAQTVRQYFAPWFSPVRDANGRIRRADREGAIRDWPGQAGAASAHPRMLMLTESTRGHGRGMLRLATREEKLLRYHVSHQHVQIDECDMLERQDIGFGSGLYPPDQFPMVPRHPRCRCWAEPAEYPPFLTRSESVPA